MKIIAIVAMTICLATAVTFGVFWQEARSETSAVRAQLEIVQHEHEHEHEKEMKAAQANQIDSVLKSLVADEIPTVRAKALEMVALKKPENLEFLLPLALKKEQDRNALLQMFQLAGKYEILPAYSMVLRGVDSEDSLVRRKASDVLGRLAGKLTDEQREEAGLKIAQLVEGEMAQQSKEKKIDANFGVYLPYISALSKLNCSRSTPILLKFLRSREHPMLRRSAALALKETAVKDDEKALVAAWRSESDKTVRAEIERVLMRDPFNLTVDRKRMSLIPKVNGG